MVCFQETENFRRERREIFMRNLLLLLLALSIPAWGDLTVKIGEVTWYTDYDQAMAQAQKRGVPLWLHFGENPG